MATKQQTRSHDLTQPIVFDARKAAAEWIAQMRKDQ